VNGSTSSCNGTIGCCDRAPSGSRTQIQVTGNRPSRTAVDYNGDVWIANRAFGGQQSVTKIANRNNNINDTDCIDRNKNNKIDSSYDANNDGIIDSDCDRNGQPDDLSTVCTGGRTKEFFGTDDECILFTTNTGTSDGWGRPLALGPGGAGDAGPSDAWPGLYQRGIFYRVDGTTGLIKDTVTIAPKTVGTTTYNSRPYGAVIDQFGILWAPNIDNVGLFYFDTNNKANQGIVVAPAPTTGGFYGVAIDGYTDANNQLVQQVWMASYGGGTTKAYRYRPVRNAGFAGLSTGIWSTIQVNGLSGNGRGVGVDNRKPVAFAWVGIDSSNNILRIPTNIGGTTMNSVDVISTYFSTNGGTGTLGTGVAADLDIWAINQGTSTATHFKVDAAGNVTSPNAYSSTTDNTDHVRLFQNALPAGVADNPAPYTYSDFTGFGLRNFTNPRGTYAWRQMGCGAGKTRWLKVLWDSDLPPLTSISLRTRSADDVPSLQSAMWYGDYTMSPADLLNPAMGITPVVPNPSGFLEIEFTLRTMDKNATPALKGFTILYECVNGLG
jgi:hypothetical protein